MQVACKCMEGGFTEKRRDLIHLTPRHYGGLKAQLYFSPPSTWRSFYLHPFPQTFTAAKLRREPRSFTLPPALVTSKALKTFSSSFFFFWEDFVVKVSEHSLPARCNRFIIVKAAAKVASNTCRKLNALIKASNLQIRSWRNLVKAQPRTKWFPKYFRPMRLRDFGTLRF